MPSCLPRAFTLTELLIVIGIIVLVAILAVPTFRTLTGARSTEAAQNQLVGLLGRARAEAVGLQQIRGVAFFLDPDSRRVRAVMVREAQRATTPPLSAGMFGVDVYIDVTPDRDPVLLPVGVGLQVVDNHGTTGAVGAARDDDAYLGFNTEEDLNGIDFTYGGVVLFDGYGRLVNRRYAFKFYTETLTATGTVKNYSELAKSLELTAAPAGLVDYCPAILPMADGAGPLRSQVGFVVYDNAAFTERGYTLSDPQLFTATPAPMPAEYTDVAGSSDDANESMRSPEAREERWIDANATPILINRNNGTLVRGQ